MMVIDYSPNRSLGIPLGELPASRHDPIEELTACGEFKRDVEVLMRLEAIQELDLRKGNTQSVLRA